MNISEHGGIFGGNNGKKFATGVAQTSSATGNAITVTGLTFTPSLIVYYYGSGGSGYVGVWSSDTAGTSPAFSSQYYLGAAYYTSGGNTGSNQTVASVSRDKATVSNTGFSIATYLGGSLNVKWVAYE